MNDLEILDEYLTSEESSDASLALSDLDGFLAGAICCPENISLSECLRIVLGNPAGVPVGIIDIVARRYEQARDQVTKWRLPTRIAP